MIMRDQVPCRPAAGVKLLAGLLLLAALPAWTFGQARPEPGPEPKVEVKTIDVRDFKPTVVRVVEEDVQLAGPDAAADAAKKLKEIEARIADLQKQLQALKAARAATGQKKKTQPWRVEIRNLDNVRAGAGALKGKLVEEKNSNIIRWRLVQPTRTEIKVVSEGPKQPQYKVIGPDGKEIKGAKVIVIETKSVQPAPAPMKVKVITAKMRALNALAGTRLELDVKLPPAADKVINLSRTTYKLPGNKAAALAAFLKDNVKASVLELKLEGQGLTVTTTPETQAAIGGIVRLMASGQAQGIRYRVIERLQLPPTDEKKK
jgi:hypothetical protein